MIYSHLQLAQYNSEVATGRDVGGLSQALIGRRRQQQALSWTGLGSFRNASDELGKVRPAPSQLVESVQSPPKPAAVRREGLTPPLADVSEIVAVVLVLRRSLRAPAQGGLVAVGDGRQLVEVLEQGVVLGGR